jgi:hypothetical protein
MLVKFLINPTGQFNLSYNLGEVVDIETKQAELLLEAKAVEVVAPAPKPSKKKPVNPEREFDAE